MELELVSSREQIRGSVRTFNRQAGEHQVRARSLVVYTRYWVYDPEERTFGPSKFVGFARMDFDTYELAQQGVVGGGEFNGGRTRRAIEEALGRRYRPNGRLAAKLWAWGERLLGPGVFDGVNEGKWRFVEV